MENINWKSKYEELIAKQSELEKRIEESNKLSQELMNNARQFFTNCLIDSAIQPKSYAGVVMMNIDEPELN